MYSYLNNEEQEEILGLEREEANLNWAAAPSCNSATLLETISRVESLPGKIFHFAAAIRCICIFAANFVCLFITYKFF